LTGLKPHVLRSWEQRYAAVCPERSEGNQRIYRTTDIRRLQLLRDAVRSGHSISQVAHLKNDELVEVVKRAPAMPEAAPEPEWKQSWEGAAANVVSDALDQVRRLDQAGLERVLSRAAVELPRPQLLHAVIQPLFERIGELWANGELKIINERLATIVTRSFLMDLLRTMVLAETAPRVVIAAPVGQWHETGALVVALTAAESGWQPLYFGPNLPAGEIAAAAEFTKSRAIALSIGHKIDRSLVVKEVRQLKNYCTQGAKIFVGGYGMIEIKQQLEPLGVRCIAHIDEFRSELEAI
jgi:DNA-binding transcriptional MerR regulator/methylmalonyl-CoA mutase cobalamin-binding subunit